MDHYTQKFSNILLDPMEWLKTAEHLLEAAKLFEPKIDAYWTELAKWARKEQADLMRFEHYVAIYFMLCSYAVENLFKAVIIQDNKATLETEIKHKAKFPAILKGHNLYVLAKKAGFDSLAAGEESILRRLTRSTIWYGRYPIPLIPEGLETLQESDNYDFKLSLSCYSSSDRNDIRRIVTEVRSRFSHLA